MLNQEFLDKQKKLLLAEKERVDKKIYQLTKPELREANPDWDDTANDAMEDVEQDSLLRIYRGLQVRVEKALKKIEEGTYGTCQKCNVEIPLKALEAEPWAEFCQALCAKEHKE